MTTGIRVTWPDSDGKVDEIEYFCGIDVNQLDHIPEFTTVPAIWPRYKGGTAVEYAVDAHCERDLPGAVRLVVVYDPANNPELAQEWGAGLWGTNTRILEQGNRHGHGEWLRADAADFEKIAWKAFDLGAGCALRPHARPIADRSGRSGSGPSFSPATTAVWDFPLPF